MAGTSTNTFSVVKSAGILAKAAAMALVDQLQFTKAVSKADPSDYEGKNGYKAGDTIYINKPARFIPNQAFDATNAMLNIVEEKVPLVANIISSVPVTIDSLELATTFDLKNLINRVIKPAMSGIASDIENRMLASMMKQTYNQVGTPGSTTFDTDTVLQAKQYMDSYLTPMDDERYFLGTSKQMRLAVGARKGLFQSATEIAKQYKSGYIGESDGFQWMQNQLLPTLTTGTQTVSGLTVTTTSTTGDTTLAVTDSGGGSETIKAGTRLTVASVYAVHPLTKVAYDFLQEFVVTADATASSGAFTLSISPTIHGSADGSLQNVSALPQANAVVNFLNGAASTSYTMGLAFHKDAYRMVSLPLVMPKAVEWAAQETYEGITIALVRAFDPKTREMITRADFLGGITAVRPEFACALTS
jgi:P22 coat protein - gene protein 5